MKKSKYSVFFYSSSCNVYDKTAIGLQIYKLYIDSYKKELCKNILFANHSAKNKWYQLSIDSGE